MKQKTEKQNLIPHNSFFVFFTEHIGAKIDVKVSGMKSRKGRIRAAFSDFVLIDFEDISSFCPGGEFYVCYRFIVDFAIIPKG